MKYILFCIAVFAFSCESKPHINVEKVKVQLDSIRVLDQDRKHLHGLYDEFGYDSDQFKIALKAQNKIDSSNLVYIEDLIERYGKYPGTDLVGHSQSDVAFLVLQHQHEDVQAKYIDVILEASKNNQLRKKDVAMFHDRYLVGIGEPQIYGTQVNITQVIDSISGERKQMNTLFPIRDTVKIDSVRLWNGMSSLENYLNSNFGISRWD